jgi:MFS family permease
MSGMTMTQSVIAAELDSYENAMWFTSSYLISISSVAPVYGRLAMIFSPGSMILASSLILASGAIVTSQAQSFSVFILGRVLFGAGGGGVLSLSMILILQLTDKRRRGLFIGLTNAVSTMSS